MSTYTFGVGCRGTNLEGVAPGVILADVIVAAVRHIYPGLRAKTERWLRGEVAKFLVQDAFERTFPVYASKGDKVVAGVNLVRIGHERQPYTETQPAESAEPGDGWEPGRWWRVVTPDGQLWCETSDEDDARARVRPGDTLERLWRCVEEEWRQEQP
ncbi:hypothetical protein LT337_32790 (plasmid) [Mycolicibacterium fortuitum]|nr:hypothetical protein LT337_32790 [Mycolicibacterium fortuitum]